MFDTIDLTRASLERVVAALGVDDELNGATGNVNTSDPIDGFSGLLAVGIVVLAARATPSDRRESG